MKQATIGQGPNETCTHVAQAGALARCGLQGLLQTVAKLVNVKFLNVMVITVRPCKAR